jgi:hypothetical protein
MSKDFQVLAFRDAANLTRIGLLTEPAMALDIYGKDFRDVSKVIINGVPALEYIVYSLEHLVATVPRSQIGAEFLSVTVLSAREINTPISVISFEAAIGNRAAEGRVRLVQNFLSTLLTTPGSNIFQRSLGGNLRKLVASTGNTGSLRAGAAQAIEATRNQLIQAQARDTRLALNERLQAASLLSVDFSPQTATLDIRLRLTAADGSTMDPAVTV